MVGDKNFYHLMLGLPEEITSPDYYEILGLERFEDAGDAIRDGAIDRNRELLKWQNSSVYSEADHLVDEAVEARSVLRDQKQKAKHDRKLREELGIDGDPDDGEGNVGHMALAIPDTVVPPRHTARDT